jgi:hypothetical protein
MCHANTRREKIGGGAYYSLQNEPALPLFACMLYDRAAGPKQVKQATRYALKEAPAPAPAGW